MKNAVIGLWIIDNIGLPLLNRTYHTTEFVDSSLFSGFITAIVAFSKHVVKDDIETIEMGGHKIHYLSFDKFAVVTTTTKKSVQSSGFILDLNKKMADIGKKFQSMYQKELDSIERNTTTFTDFEFLADQMLGQTEEGKEKSLNDFEIGLILTEIKFNKISSQEAIKRIYASYLRLDRKSQMFIKETMKDFEKFFTDKSDLKEDEIRMYKEIVGQMTVLMKSEKFFQSF